MSAPKPARLVPVEHFAEVAWLYGIRESAATLQLTGRLTRVSVGRRDFYLRDDIMRHAFHDLRARVAERDHDGAEAAEPGQ